ncbi:MAG: hypothetical protein MO852_12035 [Candidatus Devosia euplotis]|nr:hypothetical protein [Candidatus Devosia euplotis]
MALVFALALAACTTVEGTNALSDPATFEREVMNFTAHGIGLIPRRAAQRRADPGARTAGSVAVGTEPAGPDHASIDDSPAPGR